MNESKLNLARERLTETQARCRELQDRPAQLGDELRQCELRGDVAGAEEAEEALARLFGPVVAARTRADILARIVTEGEQALREAAAEAAAQQSERERRYWKNQGRDCAPRSPEAQAAADRRATDAFPDRQVTPLSGVPDPAFLRR